MNGLLEGEASFPTFGATLYMRCKGYWTTDMLLPRPSPSSPRNTAQCNVSPRDMHDPSSNGVRARATMPKRSDATVITGSNSEEEVLYECSFLIGLRLGEYIAALRNLAHPDVAHSEEGAVLQAKQHSPISSCLSPSPTLLFLFPFSSLSPAEDNAPRNCFAPIKKLC